MTGTLITITWEGLHVFDFTEPVYISEYNVINARPVVTPNMAGFIRPYTPLVCANDFNNLINMCFRALSSLLDTTGNNDSFGNPTIPVFFFAERQLSEPFS